MNKKNFLPVFVLLTLLISGFFQPRSARSDDGIETRINLHSMDTITVCSGAGICDFENIQDAIDSASAEDVIQMAGETFNESITINKNISIVGVGAQDTILEAVENSRVITVTNGVTAHLEGITIQNGSTDNRGGGILNQGNLTLSHAYITNNETLSGGGGGGIANVSGQITITNSTIANNNSSQPGGGIANYGDTGDAIIVVNNSTISLNTAEGGGGGIYNREFSGSANLSIIQTTINENGSTSGSNLHIHSGNVEISQSILANSSISGSDCVLEAGTISDRGHNLVEDGSCGFPMGGDPNLLFLTDNGGGTPTNALQSNSLALDQVSPLECASLSDQRGETRPFGAGCDIGAFELHAQSLNFSLKSSSGSNFIEPGNLITFTIIVEPIGPGISNGIISGTMSEEFSMLGPIVLNPPDSGIIGSGPPILAHSMIISATQAATLTMQTQVSLGLAAGTELFHQVSFTSNEVITPVITTATFTIKNVAPVAVDDSGNAFTTSPFRPFTTGNVLDNDYDPNGDTIILLDPTTDNLLGSIKDNLDGTYDYDPGYAFEELPPGAIAYDQFIYSITDGVGGIVQATVTIRIQNIQSSIYLPLVIQ